MRVSVAGLNFAAQETRTDAHGRFRLVGLGAPGVYFLYAEQPRYGRLLQTTFGATVVMYRKGESRDDVVIPAFPTADVSGHIYAEDGKPVAGCFVSAITKGVLSNIGTDLQVSSWHKTEPFGVAEAADPMHLKDVDWTQTDAEGGYAFRRLGADRYYLLARCDVNPWPISAEKRAWQPTFYPDAATVDAAQEIVLLPGDHRFGLNLHLRQKMAYGVQGRIRSSNGSAWKRSAFYSQDLVVVRSDEALGSTWLSREACQVYANDGMFRCSALLPGKYTFYFRVESEITQVATFRYRVSGPTVRPVEVQLRRPPDDGAVTAVGFTGPGGRLDFRRVCESNLGEQRSISVLVWGSGHAAAGCWWLLFGNSSFHGEPSLLLPAGDYTVNAFQAALSQHHYLGTSSKFESILMRHGTHVQMKTGRTAAPQLPVLQTNELIEIALEYLRAAQ